MKLYDLPPRQKPRPKIYGLEPGGHKDGYIEFDHIDGAFSYCIAYTADGKELGICHLSAFTPLTPHNDGYTLAEEPTNHAGVCVLPDARSDMKWIEIECRLCGKIGLRSLTAGQTTERYVVCQSCKKPKP